MPAPITVIVFGVVGLSFLFPLSELLYSPMRLELDYRSSSIRVFFLGRSNFEVSVEQIKGFSEGFSTFTTNRLAVLGSTILYLHDGSIREVGRLLPDRVANMLRQRGVAYLGRESTWYPLRKPRYKFVK